MSKDVRIRGYFRMPKFVREQRSLGNFVFCIVRCNIFMYHGADKSLARPTSRFILFDGENISFDVSLVLHTYIYIYIYSTNIPPIMIINRIYEHQNPLLTHSLPAI